MGLNNITRRLAAWIACCALLFAALAPALSQATPTAPWSEICSIGGTPLLSAAASAVDLSHDSTHDAFHAGHCPLCASHAGQLALPARAGFTLPLGETQASHPILFFQPARPLPIWTVAQSRAPPAPI